MLVSKLAEIQRDMSWEFKDLLLYSCVEFKDIVIKLLCEFEFVSLYSFQSFRPSGLLELPLQRKSFCQC